MLTGVLVVVSLVPGRAAHAGDFESSGPCQLNYSVEPNNQLKVIHSTLGDGCNPNSSDSDGSTWVSNPPPNGTNCDHEELVPAKVMRSGDLVTIIYNDPRTGQQQSGTVRASEIGTIFTMPNPHQEFTFSFPFQGTFQNGVCTGQYVPNPCPHLVQTDSRQPWPFPACGTPEPKPTGGMLPPGMIGPIAIDIQKQLTQLYALGTPQSLPSVRGLVNVPSCFWLAGDNAPLEQMLQLVLIGPGVGDSPNIIYTLVINVSAPGIDWHFDDPADPNDTPANLPVECVGTPATVAHAYLARSDGASQADGTFHVTATQTYAISATLSWIDAFGSFTAPVALTPDESTLTLTSQPYHFPVIQEEGVPIG